MDKNSINDKFNEIYDNTYDNITSFVIKKCDDISSIQDITQEIYSEIYDILLNKGIDYINDYNKFTYHIAKKKLFKHYNLKSKFLTVVSLSKSEITEYDTGFIEELKDSVDYEDIFIQSYQFNELLNEIKNLEKLTQKILMLYYLKDMKIKDIAVFLNINESTVKTKLYRAINRLKEKYNQGGVINDYN